MITTIGDSTPPQLVLGLEALKAATNQYGTPLAFNSGDTYFVNLPALRAATEAKLPALQTVSLVATAGQMLWRYLPLLLEDRQSVKSEYINQRRILTMLSDRTPYTTLGRILPLLRPDISAKHQRRLDITRDRKIRHTHGNPMVIGDYMTTRALDAHTTGRQFDIALRGRKVALDANTDAMNANRRVLGIARPASQPYKHTYSKDIHPTDNDCTALDVITSLKHGQIRRRRDANCDHSFFSRDNLKEGVFMQSPLFTAELIPMGSSEFGQVELSTTPFTISLNSHMAYPRVVVSLVHEILHVMDEMHKYNIPHDMIHNLALVVVQDILPSVVALAEYTNNQLLI